MVWGSDQFSSMHRAKVQAQGQPCFWTPPDCQSTHKQMGVLYKLGVKCGKADNFPLSHKAVVEGCTSSKQSLMLHLNVKLCIPLIIATLVELKEGQNISMNTYSITLEAVVLAKHFCDKTCPKIKMIRYQEKFKSTFQNVLDSIACL